MRPPLAYGTVGSWGAVAQVSGVIIVAAVKTRRG
jgi:hypothetical protein